MSVYEWQDAPTADFAVIGDPVKHSLSPAMHMAAYKALGLSHCYVAIRVAEGKNPPSPAPGGRGLGGEGLSLALDHLKKLGYWGVNVTVPHKSAALQWCEEAEPFASRVGAANTVDLRTKRCINTDAPGFMATLPEVPRRVLLLGAGGSARALAAALEEAGSEVRIYNRTRSRAEELVSSLAIRAEVLDDPDPTGADLILNTTSASLSGAALDIDWSDASSKALAYDLVYGRTPFLQQAGKAGLRTMDGVSLLVEQGALAFEWWLGVEAPREVMMEAVRSRL